MPHTLSAPVVPPESAHEVPWVRHNPTVPRANRTVFASPWLEHGPDLVRSNHVWLAESGVDVLGQSLDALRSWTREAALEAAVRYTEELLHRRLPRKPFDHVVVTGHQPELFHPGVWIKNFAAHAIAEQSYAASINLIVDNDSLHASQIAVPVGSRDEPRLEWLPFDAPHAREPWEEARILDRETFATFRPEVCRRFQTWGYQPLLGDVWRDAVRRADETDRLAECVAAARHLCERRWGLQNLELPMSRLCELDPFRWFASHLMACARTFRKIHNRVLQQYRTVNRIRSERHPVPPLEERGEWTEAPFWVWRADSSRRQRVFVRPVADGVEVAADTDVLGRLPISAAIGSTDAGAPDDLDAAVDTLRDWSAAGLRLRTRALTTTLFTRVFLADLFIHGIGGAKYDEMTDRIIARFYGLTPPNFLTLSATLWLPIGPPFDVDGTEPGRLAGFERELRFNADRYLPGGADATLDALMLEKEQLIKEQHADDARRDRTRRQRRLDRARRRRRFERLREINERLAAYCAEQLAIVREQQAEARRRLDANAVLQRRDFAFVLHNPDTLRRFLIESVG